MNFGQKLDLVLTSLQIKNIDLAEKVGVDASLISKLRTGKRNKPSKKDAIKALCAAIVEISSRSHEPNSLASQLQDVLPKSSSSAKTFEEALYNWFEEDATSFKQNVTPSTLRVFGEKFSALLDITAVTNAQIARALNVDSSLISLYKNGIRLPASQSSTVENISSFFARQQLTQQQRKALLDTIGCNEEDPSQQVLQQQIGVWLSLVSKSNGETESVGSFLEQVDNFGSFAAGKTVMPLESIKEFAGDGAKPAVFFGHKGLQQAAITYLTHVATQATPHTLHHFSDQSTEWMLGDPEFAHVWASLMVHTLAKGNQLRIIHTVNRDSSELFSAMENWIPLYMIGEIEPFYFRSGTPGRLRTSHFLAEGLALISGYAAPGKEDQAVYRYDTDPRITASAKEQFEALLSECGELMKIYKGERDIESYRIHLNAFWAREGDATALLPRLSFATFPRQLLQTKLEQAQLGVATTARILDSHLKQEQALHSQLAEGGLEELCVVESDSSVAEGKVFLDIPPRLIDEPLSYSPEEYSAHLDTIHALETRHQQYRFYPLQESPFYNIKIYCKTAGRSIVEKLSEPTVAFSFDNPHMCRGIAHFLDKLKE